MPQISSAPSGTIDSLYYYPVKGLSPQRLDEVLLETGRGFPHDRRYALARRDGRYVPGARQLLGKREFHVLMKDERLAAVRSVYDPGTDVLELFPAAPAPGTGAELPPVLTADLSTDAGRDALVGYIAGLLELPADRRPVLAEEDGLRFPDLLRTGEREMQAVSILNLASVRELGERAGVTVDPLRFRANIHLEGLEPFAERTLPGSVLECGDVRLEVFQEIARCAATEVNLGTAERDLPMLKLLYEHLGHSNMGIYAYITGGGRLTAGDAVRAGGV
ncbi:MOSC domain-containing protein [Arthrobacter sp. I2-34]|uniref:MOSC domain-containing protein n=1 Tax=Arthrobacter hankyongi TaxID=2904801 RepID=A0ABS9L7D0_9MICC|nr:MOSC domain-containing protein [Arthrobacter hankyongi]MCG2622569.1 MOSC domain-containing protein [Arthrobacter hankyongi]